MKKTKIILIAASAAMLLTGCMSREETEALSAWTVERYTAQAMAVQQRASWREERDKPEIEELQIKELAGPSSAPAPVSTREQAEINPQEVEPLPVMEMASSKAAYEPSPTPAAKEESLPTPAEPTPIPKIDWPYPAITCPPEPTPTPQPGWPESAAPTEPEPTPVPTEAPTEPDPTPAPTPEPGPVETPPAKLEPTPTPAGGYAACSCGATLTPDELIPHMKAHAINGEDHSYVAY